MLNKDFKLIEKLNDLRNIIDTFFTIPYEQRIRNRYYNLLVNKADSLAKELKNKFE